MPAPRLRWSLLVAALAGALLRVAAGADWSEWVLFGAGFSAILAPAALILRVAGRLHWLDSLAHVVAPAAGYWATDRVFAQLAGIADEGGLLELLAVQCGLAGLACAVSAGVRTWLRREHRPALGAASTALAIAGVTALTAVAANATAHVVADATLAVLALAFAGPPVAAALVYWGAGRARPALGPLQQLAVALVVVGAVVAPFAAWAHRRQDLPWQLLALSDDRTTITVRAREPSEYACFGAIDASLGRREADRITVHVTGRRVRCPNRGTSWEAGLRTVALGEPIRGERISGPSMLPIDAYAALHVHARFLLAHPARNPELLEMPQLLGLDAAQARALLGRSPGYYGLVTWRGPSRGARVVAQAPPAGAILRRAPSWYQLVSGTGAASRTPITVTARRG